MKKPPQKIDLSIVILTYNVEGVIKPCLDSVFRWLKKDWEVLVIDNNSQDNTLKIIREGNYPGLKIVENRENLGFAGANNVGVKKTVGKYILFLNPDTVVEENSISFALDYLKAHPDVGAATVKIVLGNGQLDYSCHRGYPTPWNSLCYFSGLTRLFPKVKLFSGYTLGYMDFEISHEVDAITGAYFMLPRKLGEKLNWFDTNFFWNGEDLDFSYRIKEADYKIIYLPQVKITHFKGSSGGHKRGSKTFFARFEVMKLFYDKHFQDKYPIFVKYLVHFGINLRMALAYLGI